MGSILQRPTPSRPESASREQLDLQLSRNMENWPQGRNLAPDFREEGHAFAQAQMSAQSMRAAQMHGDGMPPKQGQMPERMNINAMFLGASRHLPNDLSRQQAQHIYKNLSAAARLQFVHQLASQQSQRANAAAHSVDHSNLPPFADPRAAMQQHMSRVNYPERPAIPVGLSPEKPPASATALAPVAPGQVGNEWSQEQSVALQELKHAAPVEPPPRKRKEYSPLVPWRMTITHASCNLANTRFVESFLFYMQTEDCRNDLFQPLKEKGLTFSVLWRSL